jgi:two-component system, cell cycle sensor histidine kinase DivJ
MTAMRAQVAAMVHPSALADSLERMRHERFMSTRLTASAAALSLVPAYIAWRGRVGALELLALVAIALPLLAVFLLSRTGKLDLAHCISGAALTLLVTTLACLTGGAASPLLLWLAAVPAEAMFLGSRSYVARASALAMIGLGAVVALHGAGAIPEPASWTSQAMPVFAAMAVLHAAVITVGFLRRRDEELREHRASDARAQLMLEHVGDLVTWHDAAGSVVFANEAARSLTGAEPAQLFGRGLFERVHIADRPLFLKALSDAAHGGGRASASFRVLFIPTGDDGRAAAGPVVRWLDLSARRIEQPGPRSGAAVVCVSRDVTDRHAIDEERERNRAEAVKASDVKGRFLATVSHELRTPLNAIIGFSEMLGGELGASFSPAQRQEYARIIHDSGQHLLEVVNTLLDVSKIESGAMAIEQDSLDMAELAEDCCNIVALKAGSGKVALERIVGPDLPQLLGDRRALKQVMLNLLSNAIKFTPPGGRVTLALVRDGGMIDLSVSDTGIGIAAADLPRLGEAFFQARSSYDRAHDGTGLGLSVVRGLVGLHGGTLTIESAPGVGTRVGVRLPIGGVAGTSAPARIATFARAPRRGLETEQPVRLTA